jgi:dsRNA-specific ribonuclease
MINYLYNLDLELTPGEISDWRSLIVSNEVISFALVRMGLHKYILHSSSALAQDILRFLKHSDKSKLSDILYPLAGSNLSPNQEEYCSPPKVLGDIFESIIGAMFIDSKGDLKIVESFIMEFLVKPYLEPAMNASVNTRWGLHINPSSILGEISSSIGCTNQLIEYLPVYSNSSSIMCSINIHGIEARAKGYNKQIAKRLACSYLINGDPEGLYEKIKSICICKCKMNSAGNSYLLKW